MSWWGGEEPDIGVRGVRCHPKFAPTRVVHHSVLGDCQMLLRCDCSVLSSCQFFQQKVEEPYIAAGNEEGTGATSTGVTAGRGRIMCKGETLQSDSAITDDAAVESIQAEVPVPAGREELTRLKETLEQEEPTQASEVANEGADQDGSKQSDENSGLKREDQCAEFEGTERSGEEETQIRHAEEEVLSGKANKSPEDQSEQPREKGAKMTESPVCLNERLKIKIEHPKIYPTIESETNIHDITKPFTTEQLKSLYFNPELERLDEFVDSFLQVPTITQ